MVKNTDSALRTVGVIIVKHIFRMGESLSFGKAMKRTARALKADGLAGG